MTCDEIFLNSTYSFHALGLPNPVAVKIHKLTETDFFVKLLNYKCFLKKSMEFPQGWGPWDITFVMCGLIYCFHD